MGKLLWLWPLLLTFSNVVRAEWIQATSPNFVIYANANPTNVQRFSQELEKFHSAIALITNKELTPPSPSNRVTIYVVSSEREVQKLYGENGNNIGGFYIPRAGGSMAIVSRITGKGADLDFSKIALLHEYAHHFMFSTSAFAMPRWFSEGAAEFFASARFSDNGDVWLGRAAQHRAGELLFAKNVSVKNLIDPATYKPPKGSGYDAFYGKSWLLYHYLVFETTRSGQLAKYLQLLNQGKTSRDAGQEAFGDFDQLEKELTKYLQRSSILAVKLPPDKLHPGVTELRTLRPGEAAMMPLVIRSKRGVNNEIAAALITEARAVAAKFPGDAAVLSALAEAEFDSGHDAEAIAAADAAIALDRNQVNAYLQKGYAWFRLARQSDDPLAYRKARAPFIALNKIENDHPLPLIYFYQSFVLSGEKPSQNAVLGLERASLLSPFDLNLRMLVARQQLNDGFKDVARITLAPVAYNPHGGELAELAQRYLARMDADPNWDGKE